MITGKFRWFKCTICFFPCIHNETEVYPEKDLLSINSLQIDFIWKNFTKYIFYRVESSTSNILSDWKSVENRAYSSWVSKQGIFILSSKPGHVRPEFQTRVYSSWFLQQGIIFTPRAEPWNTMKKHTMSSSFLWLFIIF